MEFIPACSVCNNFENGDKCPYFKGIPFEIKNREVKCEHFDGDKEEYILYSEEE